MMFLIYIMASRRIFIQLLRIHFPRRLGAEELRTFFKMTEIEKPILRFFRIFCRKSSQIFSEFEIFFHLVIFNVYIFILNSIEIDNNFYICNYLHYFQNPFAAVEVSQAAVKFELTQLQTNAHTLRMKS